MTVISKIAGFTAKKAAQYLGKAPKITKMVEGIPVSTYLKTGTKVAHNVDGQGAKTIIFGAGNSLKELVGQVTVYPKNSFFGGKTGMILVGKPGGKILPLEPKEFGDFVKLLKEMKKANV